MGVEGLLKRIYHQANELSMVHLAVQVAENPGFADVEVQPIDGELDEAVAPGDGQHIVTLAVCAAPGTLAG